jgi:hypothetical protein
MAGEMQRQDRAARCFASPRCSISRGKTEGIEPMTDTQTETQAEPKTETPHVPTAQEFAEAIERAEAKLDQARAAERVAREKVRRKRIELEEAVSNWQRQFPPRTLKDELEAQKRVDADRRLNGYTPPLPAIGKSVLDQTLAAGRSRDIETGSGRRPRGGTGKQLKGTMVPKLPSQR